MTARELLVCTALASEAEALLRGGTLRRGLVAAPGEVHELSRPLSRAALAGFAGMGAAAVGRLFEALAKDPGSRPTRVVFGGVAGALRAGLEPGALFLCSAALDTTSGETLACDTALTERLAVALARANVPFERGVVLEVPAIAGGAPGKRDLARRFPAAHLVAMEDAAAIRGARALGAEVTIVRVVIDRLDDSLPDLTPALDGAGRPRPLKLAAHLASRPSAVLALPGLARSFNRARATLDRALEAALDLA